jgi:hypothetical protein
MAYLNYSCLFFFFSVSDMNRTSAELVRRIETFQCNQLWQGIHPFAKNIELNVRAKKQN